ncbi:MAG: hypothetical protein UX87_C0011G0024, partial [Candidatus Amesbacteria bacterium GW2011_GWA1_47_16]
GLSTRATPAPIAASSNITPASLKMGNPRLLVFTRLMLYLFTVWLIKYCSLFVTLSSFLFQNVPG